MASVEDSSLRYEVLLEVTLKITVFWYVTLCSLVEVYWHDCSACKHFKEYSAQLFAVFFFSMPQYTGSHLTFITSLKQFC